MPTTVATKMWFKICLQNLLYTQKEILIFYSSDKKINQKPGQQYKLIIDY